MVKIFKTLFKSERSLDDRGYRLLERVGHGTYSTVYRGTRRDIEKGTEKEVAIKIIDEKMAAQDFIQVFLPRELEISKLVNHVNLLTTLEHFQLNNKSYIITELARFDLLQYLRLKGGLRETLARRIFYELISGINHLHQNGLVHRDIKCENMLISNDGTIKVADFGFARKLSDSELSTTYCGSTAYTAPEVLAAKGPYDPKISDTWSCGVILYILFTASMPFSKNQLSDIIKTKKVEVALPPDVLGRLTPDANEIMQSILTYVPTERPVLSALLTDHNWFQSELRRS